MLRTIGKEQAGDYKTNKKHAGPQNQDAFYRNYYKLYPFLNGQKAGVFAFTRPEQYVLCGLGHNAFTAFSNKVT